MVFHQMAIQTGVQGNQITQTDRLAKTQQLQTGMEILEMAQVVGTTYMTPTITLLPAL